MCLTVTTPLKKKNNFLQKNTKQTTKNDVGTWHSSPPFQGSTAAVEPLWVSWPPSWDPWGAANALQAVGFRPQKPSRKI